MFISSCNFFNISYSSSSSTLTFRKASIELNYLNFKLLLYKNHSFNLSINLIIGISQ